MEKFALYILTFVLFSCFQKSDNNLNKRAINKNDEEEGQTFPFFISDTIGNKSNYLKIINLPLDSLSEDSKLHVFYKYPMKDQIVEIYKNNKRVKKLIIPSSCSQVKLTNGNVGLVKDHLIYLLGIIEGSRETIYYLEGFGGCNTCESVVLLLDMGGNILSLYYIDKSKEKKHPEEFGDYKQIMKKIGFDLEKYEKGVFRNNSPFKEETFELFLGV